MISHTEAIEQGKALKAAVNLAVAGAKCFRSSFARAAKSVAHWPAYTIDGQTVRILSLEPCGKGRSRFAMTTWRARG